MTHATDERAGKRARTSTVARVKERLGAIGRNVQAAYMWAEDKPLMIVLVAAGATVAAILVLASSAGWERVLHLLNMRHSWSWLVVCLAGEVAAYAGYTLTLRDVARVDDGAEIGLPASVRAVVAGFGVFAATRSTGGFAVDYWAFRRSGATQRDAVSRVFALGFLEYLVLSVAALGASFALFFRLDGHASPAVTLPSLLLVPAVVVILYVTSPRRARRLGRARRTGWFRKPFANAVRGATTTRALVTSPRAHGVGVLGQIVYWAGDILCLWAALQLVHAQITVAALVLGYSGGYVLTRRALPAGGSGIVEVALTLALVGMGLQFARALLGVVVYRLFNFWLPIIPALALMPAVKELRGRFQRAEKVA